MSQLLTQLAQHRTEHAAQRSTAQHSAAQHSTAQRSIAQQQHSTCSLSASSMRSEPIWPLVMSRQILSLLVVNVGTMSMTGELLTASQHQYDLKEHGVHHLTKYCSGGQAYLSVWCGDHVAFWWLLTEIQTKTCFRGTECFPPMPIHAIPLREASVSLGSATKRYRSFNVHVLHHSTLCYAKPFRALPTHHPKHQHQSTQ